MDDPAIVHTSPAVATSAVIPTQPTRSFLFGTAQALQWWTTPIDARPQMIDTCTVDLSFRSLPLESWSLNRWTAENRIRALNAVGTAACDIPAFGVSGQNGPIAGGSELQLVAGRLGSIAENPPLAPVLQPLNLSPLPSILGWPMHPDSPARNSMRPTTPTLSGTYNLGLICWPRRGGWPSPKWGDTQERRYPTAASMDLANNVCEIWLLPVSSKEPDRARPSWLLLRRNPGDPALDALIQVREAMSERWTDPGVADVNVEFDLAAALRRLENEDGSGAEAQVENEPQRSKETSLPPCDFHPFQPPVWWDSRQQQPPLAEDTSALACGRAVAWAKTQGISLACVDDKLHVAESNLKHEQCVILDLVGQALGHALSCRVEIDRHPCEGAASTVRRWGAPE